MNDYTATDFPSRIQKSILNQSKDFTFVYALFRAISIITCKF